MKKTEINGQTITILKDEKEIFSELAARIEGLAESCIKDDGLFSMALSGGNTPRGLYSFMAEQYAESFPWKKTYLFLGDERCVSHNDGDSNYKMISDSLLSRISIPSTNVFPTINQDKDPEDSARRYEQALKRFFKEPSADNGVEPRFSLCLMGLGPDGHTASLFPGTAAVDEQERLCVANYVDKLQTHRITLTRPVFKNSRKLFFLVAGESKADIFADVLSKKEGNHMYPSQVVISDCRPGAVEWFVDEACASKFLQASPTKE